jgi:hypothetical protein
VIRISFVCIPYTSAKRTVALLTRIGSRFGLSSEWTTELLSARELQNIVCYGASFRAALRTWFDVDIRHLISP